MSPRKLRPDELDLWKKVARTTDRVHEKMPDLADLSQIPKQIGETLNPVGTGIRPFNLGQNANSKKPGPLLGLNGAQAKAPINMDKKAYDRLKRGKLAPQGRIDLHGMTLNQAQPKLTAFIMSAFAKDHRLVLVITGKGKQKEDFGPIPERPGVLRRNVPHWLQTPPLAQMVLQVTEAHGRHGGGGAYYVYLRRRR